MKPVGCPQRYSCLNPHPQFSIYNFIPVFCLLCIVNSELDQTATICFLFFVFILVQQPFGVCLLAQLKRKLCFINSSRSSLTISQKCMQLTWISSQFTTLSVA